MGGCRKFGCLSGFILLNVISKQTTHIYNRFLFYSNAVPSISNTCQTKNAFLATLMLGAVFGT